MAKQKAKFLVS